MNFIFQAKCWIVLSMVIFLLFKGSVSAQTLPFTNHTEIGMLQSNQTFGRHASFTFQTFNGVQANKWLRLGFTTGLDTYHQSVIIPFALGARGVFSRDQKFSPILGLDLGFGSTLLEDDSKTEWTEGGFMMNPTVGLLMKTQGKARLSLTVGYKRQVISEYTGILDPTATSRTGSLPPGYLSIAKDEFTFNRASIRLGLFF